MTPARSGEPEPTERIVDGVPVRTYRGASLAELAPRIQADLGDRAMIVRQREGLSGGIGGFFARRLVEVDVAVLDGPAGRVDLTDGPQARPDGSDDEPAPGVSRALGGEDVAPDLLAPLPPRGHADAAPQASAIPAPGAPSHQGGAAAFGQQLGSLWQQDPSAPLGSPPAQPLPGASSVQPDAPGGSSQPTAIPARDGGDTGQPLRPSSGATAGQREDPLAARIAREREQARRARALDAAHRDDRPFDDAPAGATPPPSAPSTGAFEEQLRLAGLVPGRKSQLAEEMASLRAALVRHGLPEQIASPVVEDALRHRAALDPSRPPAELVAAELARRIPTAPLVGRPGNAIAFVGSSGSGKSSAIARLAAAYGAAGDVPVACVTLESAGDDDLLSRALAPYGIAVHAAPDAPRALDRITALRRSKLVLVDVPGVSPGDHAAVERLGALLALLELDEVALCLQVVLAAPIARRMLRVLEPLAPSVLVATHADDADLLGGVVAVAIDRRVPLSYISAGARAGTIRAADPQLIARELLDGAVKATPASPSGRTSPVPEAYRRGGGA